MVDKKDVAFFHRWAGWSYNKAQGETPNAGRARGARQLARAEQWARHENITFDWQPDWEVGNHHDYYGKTYSGGEPTTCEIAFAVSPDGDVLASLGCIDDADSNYRRVINAELALEAMDRLEAHEDFNPEGRS